MTLCIGAICNHEDEPRIVLCEDWQQETSFAGGEVSDKLKWLDGDNKWAAQIADSGGRGIHLVDSLRKHLKGKDSIANDDIFSLLEDGLATHKFRLANEFFQSKYAVSYDDILSNGLEKSKRRFPDKFIEEGLERLEKVSFDAQLIIAGFATGGIPVLFSVNEDLYSHNAVPLRRDENFVAIGSGAPSALMTLYRRRHIGTETPLLQGLYHVFEAMVLSEGVSPGVGNEIMSIEILSPNAPPLSLSDAGYDYLSRRYDNDFGPRPIEARHKFKFNPKYVEDFEFDWQVRLKQSTLRT